MAENFCFVLENIKYKGKLPEEIIPGHWFSKATIEEIQNIKQKIEKYGAHPTQVLAMYEHRFVPKETTSHPLSPEDWKYYVITFDGPNDKIRDIEYSASLLKNDITIGLVFTTEEFLPTQGYLYNPAIISNFFNDSHINLVQEISFNSNELREITNNYNDILSLDKHRYGNISRAISDFYYTKMITNLSMLKNLSYFIIIECLVTHDPKNIADSLTHQISTKMPLLSKRFQRKLDYTSHFPSLKEPERVWKKLYSYRSAIAHGSEVNFNGEFKCLIDQDNIRKFLKESLKLLLLYSLKEPEFITDIKKC